MTYFDQDALIQWIVFTIGLIVAVIFLVRFLKTWTEIAKPETRKCFKCGKEIPYDAQICPHCQFDYTFKGLPDKPSLEYAKKHFTPRQYKFLLVAMVLFIVNIFYGFLLRYILLKVSPGWSVILATLGVLLQFVTVPLFVVAFILYFVFLGKSLKK